MCAMTLLVQNMTAALLENHYRNMVNGVINGLHKPFGEVHHLKECAGKAVQKSDLGG